MNFGVPGPSRLGTGDRTHAGYTNCENALERLLRGESRPRSGRPWRKRFSTGVEEIRTAERLNIALTQILVRIGDSGRVLSGCPGCLAFGHLGEHRRRCRHRGGAVFAPSQKWMLWAPCLWAPGIGMLVPQTSGARSSLLHKGGCPRCLAFGHLGWQGRCPRHRESVLCSLHKGGCPRCLAFGHLG